MCSIAKIATVSAPNNKAQQFPVVDEPTSHSCSGTRDVVHNPSGTKGALSRKCDIGRSETSLNSGGYRVSLAGLHANSIDAGTANPIQQPKRFPP